MVVVVCRLDLRNNYLTTLTEFTFRDLSSLRYLFLTNNRIYRIERRALRHLPQLLYLVLRGNPLDDVDRLHFHSPSTLSYVDMSECGLTRVPRGLPAALRYVQLRRNNLTTLDAGTFSECLDVNILVLDENNIQTVHDNTFADMSNLQQVRRVQTPSAINSASYPRREYQPKWGVVLRLGNKGTNGSFRL